MMPLKTDSHAGGNAQWDLPRAHQALPGHVGTLILNSSSL